jgi:hypothetical protein
LGNKVALVFLPNKRLENAMKNTLRSEFIQMLKVAQDNVVLKGLSHEVYRPVYWPVWMHLGLNKNRFWFLNFKGAPSIYGRHFKFLCVSVQTFQEILRISEKDWQLRT